jgi:hypothetical protein
MWNDLVKWERRNVVVTGEIRNKIRELRRRENHKKIMRINDGDKSYMKKMSRRTVSVEKRTGTSPATKGTSEVKKNQMTQASLMAVDTSGSLARLIQREKVISAQDDQKKKIEKKKLEATKARIHDLEKQMDLGNEEGQKRARARLEKEQEKERTANLLFDRTKKTRARWSKERKLYKKALMDNINKVVENTLICSECKLPHEKDLIRISNVPWNAGNKLCIYCIRKKGITNVSVMP